MNKDLIRKILFFGGTIGIFVAGIVYNLCSDLFTKTQSTWLFASILLAFGSGCCSLFSDKLKEKHKSYFAIKGVAVGLALLFVVFLIIYQVVAIPAFESPSFRGKGTVINVVTMVVSVLSMGALAADLYFSVKSIQADEE